MSPVGDDPTTLIPIVPVVGRESTADEPVATGAVGTVPPAAPVDGAGDADAPAARPRPRWVVPAVVVGFLALVAAGFTIAALLAGGGGDTETVAVELVAANDIGADPFTEDISVVLEKERHLARERGEEFDLSSSDSAGADADLRITTVAADTDRGVLYGTRERPTGKVGRLKKGLEEDAEAAEAWADLMGVSVTEIDEVIDDLRPLVLTRDTAVTNSRYVDGRGKRFQAVLEAGTAVLVDEAGVPRVKCAGGNPLAPADTATRASLSGKLWDGFDPRGIVAIDPASVGTEGLAAIDLDTGELTIVPLSGGAPAASDKVSAPLTTEAAPPPTAQTPTTAPPPPPPPLDGFIALGYGPLRIGMDRSEAQATGWVVGAATGCWDSIEGLGAQSDLEFRSPDGSVSGRLEFHEETVDGMWLSGSPVLPNGDRLVPGDGRDTVKGKIRAAGGEIGSEFFEEMAGAWTTEIFLPGGIDFEMYLHDTDWSIGIPRVYVCD